jgi:hypothetical protein
MRILIHGAPPYATSGYGKYCKAVASALRDLGHDVAISMYAGVHEERIWNGIQLLGTGGNNAGNGVIALNYRRWKSDCMIVITDPFVLMPDQFKGLTVFPWVPVDVEPLGVMDHMWLDQLAKIADVHPIAMSEHAKKMMAAKDIESVYIPMATELRPDEAAGRAWRDAKSIPEDMFLIAKIGVNNEDDRKAYTVTLHAFSSFIHQKSMRGRKTGLYLHCQAQARKSPNLAHMAAGLGLKNHIAFCDEEMRSADVYDDDYLHGMYNAADVLDAVSKGEGFGVPIIEALACGTPVITSRNSACTEKISPEWGWLVSGQKEWAMHHQAAWQTPFISEVERAYEKARVSARGMRKAAAAAGARWSTDAMRDALQRALG